MLPNFEGRVVGAGAAVVIHLYGELDLATAPELSSQLASLIGAGSRHVTVDLAELEFIDSSGLHVLVSAYKQLRELGGDLALRSPNPTARKVFEITGLADVFTIVDGNDGLTDAQARSGLPTG